MSEVIQMEQISLPNAETTRSNENLLANTTTERRRSERPATASCWRGIQNRILSSNPVQVPLSPNTRRAANEQTSSTSNTVNLKPVRLTAYLNRDLVTIEPVEAKKKYLLSVIIDCTEETTVKLQTATSKNTVLGTHKLSNPGLNLKVQFEIPLKTYPTKPVVYRVVCVPSDRPISDSTPVQKSLIEVSPVDQHGALSASVTTQTLEYDRSEFEILEIYGQYPEGSPETSAVVKDLADNSFVSIQMEPSKETERADCVICLNSARDTLFLPCRHMCICASCAESLVNGDGKCPLCRQNFTNMLSIRDETRNPHKADEQSAEKPQKPASL